jgi:catechol 2,3-dioxygenase-like lactoylglutathione lyase family enzyme
MTLADSAVVVNLGSSDLARTVAFYEGTLGLPVVERREILAGHPEVVFRAGGATICVEGGGSPSPHANPPFSFVVADVPETAAALRERGVVFEEYDLPFLKTDDGIATIGPVRAAWFKDPDGYLLAILEEAQPNP